MLCISKVAILHWHSYCQNSKNRVAFNVLIVTHSISQVSWETRKTALLKLLCCSVLSSPLFYFTLSSPGKKSIIDFKTKVLGGLVLPLSCRTGPSGLVQRWTHERIAEQTTALASLYSCVTLIHFKPQFNTYPPSLSTSPSPSPSSLPSPFHPSFPLSICSPLHPSMYPSIYPTFLSSLQFLCPSLSLSLPPCIILSFLLSFSLHSCHIPHGPPLLSSWNVTMG